MCTTLQQCNKLYTASFLAHTLVSLLKLKTCSPFSLLPFSIHYTFASVFIIVMVHCWTLPFTHVIVAWMMRFSTFSSISLVLSCPIKKTIRAKLYNWLYKTFLCVIINLTLQSNHKDELTIWVFERRKEIYSLMKIHIRYY